MKKKSIFIFSLFMLFVTFFAGCSNVKIDKIEFADDTVKLNYIVGEELNFDNFEIKVTYIDKSEKIYYVTNEQVAIGEYDNTQIGRQDLDININHTDGEFNFTIQITFDVTDEVKNIVKMISELPSKISLSDEKSINLIENEYLKLDEFFKNYVTNYDKYIESKETLANLKEELLTTEVLNERFIYKNNLINFYESLNKHDYSEDSWNNITDLYNSALESIQLDENYMIVKKIVDDTKEEILKVNTLAQIEFEELKNTKYNELVSYKDSLDKNDYSNDKWKEIINILNNSRNEIMNSNSNDMLEYCYNNCLNLINEVLTLDEEEMINLNILRNDKITELYMKLSEIDVTSYSLENKEMISNKYDEYVNYIKSANDSYEMDLYIIEFIDYVNELATLENEAHYTLENLKKYTKEYITNAYKNIYLYDYDSENRALIQSIYTKSLVDIELCDTKEKVNTIKSEVISQFNKIPTMAQQAENELNDRKNMFISEFESKISGLNKNNYSEENWIIILNKIEGFYSYIDNITIRTATATVNDKINKISNEINNVLNIEEEYAVLLKNTKTTAKQTIENFYNILNENNYTTAEWNIITTRINYTISIIDSINDVDQINKLVTDTIDIISSVK